MLYKSFTNVEIIGSIFPRFGQEIWEPIVDTPITKRSFIVKDEANFIRQATDLVINHPYDIVHLSKPRAPNIIIGVLYKVIWGAKILMDVDDEELAFVNADTPISIEQYLRQNDKLPFFYDLAGKTWTRISVGMVKKFDGVTVSNKALQERYGGVIIPHARDQKLYNPSSSSKRQSREKFGIPQEKKVVLFFGTPRSHKGLIETARAIASLKRNDVLFMIVGEFTDKKLKESLINIHGVEYFFIGNQPVSQIPTINALSDVCVFLQDIGSSIAQFQIPAKLSDALAMCIPVICTKTPALKEFSDAGAVLFASQDEVSVKLEQIFDEPNLASSMGNAARRYFEESLSFSVSIDRLEKIVSNHKSCLASMKTIKKIFLNCICSKC